MSTSSFMESLQGGDPLLAPALWPSFIEFLIFKLHFFTLALVNSERMSTLWSDFLTEKFAALNC